MSETALVIRPDVSKWDGENPLMSPRHLGKGLHGEAELWATSESAYAESIPGLGRWPMLDSSRQATLCTEEFAPSLTWIQDHAPKNGTLLVRKVPREARELPEYSGIEETIENMMRERAALLRSEDAFDTTDRCRPAFLVGYGMATNISTQFPDRELPYLLLEYIPSTFLSIQEYVKQNGDRLALSESVMIAADLAEMLGKLHRKGVAHRDLALGSFLRNLRYNPSTKEMRILDFGNAGITHTFHDYGYRNDRSGVIEMLYHLITGKDIHHARYEFTVGNTSDVANNNTAFLEYSFKDIAMTDLARTKLLEIFSKQESYSPGSYNNEQGVHNESNPEGTKRLVDDLRKLQQCMS